MAMEWHHWMIIAICKLVRLELIGVWNWNALLKHLHLGLFSMAIFWKKRYINVFNNSCWLFVQAIFANIFVFVGLKSTG
jgi:hypothetical protein